MEFKSRVVPRGTDNAKLIKVIRTESIIGAGTEKDPLRTIYQYWNLKGQLLAKNDTYKDKYNHFDVTISSASSDIKS